MNELSPLRRHAVALAAATRLVQMYELWRDDGVARALSDRLWRFFSGKEESELVTQDQVENLYPGEDFDSDPYSAGAEDFLSALQYVVMTLETDSTENAAFSLERAYECAFQTAFVMVVDRTVATLSAANGRREAEFAEKQPVVARELSAQARDMQMAENITDDESFVARLMDIARKASFLSPAEVEALRSKF